jgi:hypothetical protein
MSVPQNVADLLGDTPISMSVGTDIVTGFINQGGQYRNTYETDSGWLNTLFGRGELTLNVKRSVMAFSRGHRTTYGTPVQNKLFSRFSTTGQKIIPLYTISEAALITKCNILGVNVPDRTVWIFDVLGGSNSAINDAAINGRVVSLNYLSTLTTYFTTVFFRTTAEAPRHQFLPDYASRVWNPSSPSDLTSADRVVAVRIIDDVLGVYLVTSNLTLVAPCFDAIPSDDSVTMTIPTKINRGMGPSRSQYYMLRGRGNLSYNSVYGDVNAAAINDLVNTPTVSNAYTDSVNTTPVTITRAGTVITHSIKL